MINPYRIKHIPSGLYYQAAKGYNKSNLSTKGKVYIVNNSPLYDRYTSIHIQVDHNTKVFNKLKGILPLNRNGDISCEVQKEQFIREDI